MSWVCENEKRLSEIRDRATVDQLVSIYTGKEDYNQRPIMDLDGATMLLRMIKEGRIIGISYDDNNKEAKR